MLLSKFNISFYNQLGYGSHNLADYVTKCYFAITELLFDNVSKVASLSYIVHQVINN